jgi:hypothetical protein
LISALVPNSSVPENFTFYYEGASFHVTGAEDKGGNVVLSAEVTNPTADPESLYESDFVLSDGTTPVTSSVSASISSLPAGASGMGQITFQVPADFDAADTVLTVGPPSVDQVVVPFSSPAKARLLTPVPIRLSSKPTALGPDAITLTGAELRFDDPTNQNQASAGQALVEMGYNFTCEESQSCAVGSSQFLLVSPTGTSSGSTGSSDNASIDAGATAGNFVLFFQVPYPTEAGTYEVKVAYVDNAGKTLNASIPITIPGT